MDKLLLALLIPVDWLVAHLWPAWGWRALQGPTAPAVDPEPAAPVDASEALLAPRVDELHQTTAPWLETTAPLPHTVGVFEPAAVADQGTPEPLLETAVAGQGVPERPRRRRRTTRQLTGDDAAEDDYRHAEEPGTVLWRFRSTILDRLDDYFVCMRRMRGKDPLSYDLFSRTGFAVPAELWLAHDRDVALPPLGPDRPAFGGVLCGMAPTTGDIYPAFCYFQKLTHSPVRVQAFAGEVYRLTCLYDNRSDLSEPCTCHLGVLPDGQLQLLKEPRTYWTQLETGRRHGHRDRFHLRQTAWAYPAWVTMEPERDRDPARWTGWLLRMALDTYLASLERIVVRAHQGGCVAAFGIDLKRGPVFFKDRDKETALARDGKRKRIFHAVRSHVRQVPGGPTTVQAHYRGLRTFLWNGRRIHIVLPELTHLLDCPVAAEPLEPEPADMRPWLTEGQLGEHVAEKLEQ